jgi:hypothetical protein
MLGRHRGAQDADDAQRALGRAANRSMVARVLQRASSAVPPIRRIGDSRCSRSLRTSSAAECRSVRGSRNGRCKARGHDTPGSSAAHDHEVHWPCVSACRDFRLSEGRGAGNRTGILGDIGASAPARVSPTLASVARRRHCAAEVPGRGACNCRERAGRIEGVQHRTERHASRGRHQLEDRARFGVRLALPAGPPRLARHAEYPPRSRRCCGTACQPPIWLDF